MLSYVSRKCIVGEKALKKLLKIGDSFQRKERECVDYALRIWLKQNDSSFDFLEPDKYIEKGFNIEKDVYEQLKKISQERNITTNRLFAKAIAEWLSWQ